MIKVGIHEDPEWPVYICRSCRLRYIEPRFSDLKEYYRSEYRKGHTESRGHTGEEQPEETVEERYQIQKFGAKESAHAFIGKVPEGASVLEVGCSAGGFLSLLEGKYDLFATEWNAEDAAFVRNAGVPCEERDLLDVYPGQKFTAIVARQVLEHQPDPVEFLAQCRERLIGGGWLFLEMPNALNALTAAYQIKEHQDWWYSEPHITYWEPETLANLLSATGYEAQIRPFQRFGLMHTMVWLSKRMSLPKRESIEILQPIRMKHPLAPPLNRIWKQLDQIYRVQMETLGCADYIRAMCRRREI